MKKERTNSGTLGHKILDTHRQVIQDTEEKKEGPSVSEVESKTKTRKSRQERILQRKKVVRQEDQSRRLSLKERTGFKQDDRNLELSLVIEGDMPVI